MKDGQIATLPLSVVIPTFSEEERLPGLLESINKQKIKPAEIIVADAQSPDKTRDIALRMGAKVVDGGKIAKGRNAGAKVAKSEYILFLDADSRLPKDTTLAAVFLEFLKLQSDIASTAYAVNVEEVKGFGQMMNNLFYPIYNWFRRTQSKLNFVTAEGGAFILVKKSVFEHLGGFDENYGIGEDFDLFKRAIKLGYKYNSLQSPITTSIRRIDSMGKLMKMIGISLVGAAVIALGAKAGSVAVRKISKKYGRLGGGKGKDQYDED